MAFELVQEEGSMPIHNDTASQLSQPTTDTANTQTTQTSPSTSASSLLHQEERLTARPPSTQIFSYPAVDIEAIEALRALSQSNSSRSSVSTHHTSGSETRPTAYHAGHKRTATGDFKAPVTSAQSSPWRGHSRHSSAVSNASTVTELAQNNLRPFLSYAKLKADNGWEHNTITEVETIVSQHGSPRSLAPGTPRQYWNSPRVDWSATSTTQRGWEEGGSAEDRQGVAGRAPMLHSHAALQRFLGPGGDSQIKTEPGPRQSSGYVGRGGGDERGTGPHNGLNLSINIPSTPDRRRAHTQQQQPTGVFKQRTPSQTKAMEEEALETLMFMSSPGNSHQHRSRASTVAGPSSSSSATNQPDFRVPQSQQYSQPQTSPLRQSNNPYSNNNHTRSPMLHHARRDEDVDELLDSMEASRKRERLPSEEVEFLRRNGLGGLVDSVG